MWNLELDRNTWNYVTVCKLFILRRVTWSYNCLQIIIVISNLKQYDWKKKTTLALKKKKGWHANKKQPTNQPVNY